MTSWPDQPTEASAQPQTRRQAREQQRSAARQAARRAGTAEPTPAGEIPTVTTTASVNRAPDAADTPPDVPDVKEAAPRPAVAERPTIPATAFAEPLVSSPSSAQSLFQRAPEPGVAEPVTTPVSVVKERPAAPATPERTLTRRELRAMLQAQEANQANHGPQLAEPIVPVTFTSTEEGTGKASSTGGEPASDATPAEADAPVPSSTKTAWPFAAVPSPAPVTAAGTAPAPSADRVDTGVSQSPASASPFSAFGVAPVPGAAASGSAAPGSAAPAPAVAAAGSTPVPVEEKADDAEKDATPAAKDADHDPSQERRPFTPPTGHWSTAAELDDKNEPIISRSVGQSTAATTTNALILPSIPQPDATAPLTSTGEIMVTGSIDLPRGMGATGANPERIDSSDIDRLLDGEENEFNTSEVAPVRASRAISSHSSTRGVITPPKKRGNALPVVLMVVAGVLAVGVISLLIAAYVLKVF